MPETTEIPIDASGFDRFIGTLQNTATESKKVGEQLKRAFAAEVLVPSIGRLGAAIGGVEGKAVSAVGLIAGGFAAGGPIGGAIAATTVAMQSLFDVIEFGRKKLADQDAIQTRIALERVDQARQVRQAEAAAERAAADAKSAQDAIDSARDAARTARRVASAAANKRIEDETFAYLRDMDQRLADAGSQAQRDEEVARDAAFADELDAEAEHAMRLRDVRDAARQADRESAEQSRIDAVLSASEEARQQEVIAQQRSEAIGRIAERQAAFEQSQSDRIRSELQASAAMQAFTGEAMLAVGALTALDGAQIAAAISAEDFGQQAVAAALRATSAILQQIAQEATVKALLSTAEGFAKLSNPLTASLAAASFAAAGQYAVTAAAAGAGAIALNTGAAAIAPQSTPRASQTPRDTFGFGTGQERGSGGGGMTVVINTRTALTTTADVGRELAFAQQQARRYYGG